VSHGGAAAGVCWSVATAVRALPGEAACGDAVWVKDDGERLLVAVVDGLGHGPAAAAAAQATIAGLDALDPRAWGSLEGVLTSLHGALRRTRGVAVSLLRVEPTSVAFAGVGNVRCESSVDGFAPFPREGILGYRYQGVRTVEAPAGAGRIVLHTDGLTRFRLADWPAASASDLAGTLLAERGDPRDDAGLAVIELGTGEAVGRWGA
jgi:hypothetical protein